MPTQVATDTFTGVAGTNLTAHTADTGQAWAKSTETGDGVLTATGRARGGAVKTRYDLNVTPSTTAVTIDVDVVVVTLAASAGIMVRSSGANTRIQFFYSVSGQTWNIEDGAGSIVATSSVDALTLNQAYHIQLVCADSSKTLFRDGVQMITTASNLTTANGKVGFQWSADASASDARGVQFDNLVVTDPATGVTTGSMLMLGVGA